MKSPQELHEKLTDNYNNLLNGTLSKEKAKLLTELGIQILELYKMEDDNARMQGNQSLSIEDISYMNKCRTLIKDIRDLIEEKDKAVI